MVDIVARAPYNPSPDLNAYLDASEVDLWARKPFYPSPDLIAYGAGPILRVTAVAGGSTIVVSMGLSSETDTVPTLSLKKILTTSFANETNTASALSLKKIFATGRADETNSTFTLGLLKKISVGQASESDSSLPLTFLKKISVGISNETDTAFALTFNGFSSTLTVTKIFSSSPGIRRRKNRGVFIGVKK